MPYSPDLTNIVNKFIAIDPAQHSIDEQYNQLAKRTTWQNILGYVIHIITFGLIAKNPELDRTTNKIITVTNSFFEDQKNELTRKELKDLLSTFEKLETVVADNGGCNFSEVHALAIRIKYYALEGRITHLLNNDKDTLIQLFDGFEIPDPNVELTVELKNKLDKLQKQLIAKFESILAGDDITEILELLKHTKKTPDKFEAAIYIFHDLNKNPAWNTIEILKGIEWPSVQLKAKVLAEIAERSNDIEEEVPEPSRGRSRAVQKQKPQETAAVENQFATCSIVELIKGFDENQAGNKEKARQIYTTLCDRFKDANKSRDYSQIVAAFGEFKANLEAFETLLSIFVEFYPYSVVATSQFLEKLQWPSEKRKEELLPAILADKEIMVWQETFFRTGSDFLAGINANKAQIHQRMLFSDGDHTTNPLQISPFLAKGLGDKLRNLGAYVLKKLKQAIVEQKDLTNIPMGFEIGFSQATECRFPATMVAPFLPYFTNIPGLIRIDLADIGVVFGSRQSKFGFADRDVEALLNIARTNPYLREMKVNDGAMSVDVQTKFRVDLKAILDARTGDLAEELKTLANQLAV